ncbi:hypothetical protein AA0242T_0651 [Acetobacter aceti NRIC 0242]|uniref:Uncharacterized protein n=1 Tax=Acetobacter aceti NBRC 14818 TaxID=887700 RepID=A0AB33IEX2_ACEAC|nr:hypothetical protein [Acetobacter aceti]TCS33930.1 hypothetical protein EDC15_105143 [Acetobacter aceti NBRC 14818]BCK76064.1 hypothetical protein EMQ_1670 [Acetobacter aceti NBRC 14818]GAN57628.1 hypothetical protein Abac_018_041 [Acetobacter aceti NBRC 14818]GBO79949.1 hypothetical protein AA0242T_0651 [Acetobacter aceti NRIC 0242]
MLREIPPKQIIYKRLIRFLPTAVASLASSDDASRTSPGIQSLNPLICPA